MIVSDCAALGVPAARARRSASRHLCGLLRHQASWSRSDAPPTAVTSQRAGAPAGHRRSASSRRDRRHRSSTSCAISTSASRRFSFVTAPFLVRYQPPELQPLVDEDVAEAAAALAATFETASRGRHLRASPPRRLAEVGWRRPEAAADRSRPGRRTAFERDAAVVLRRIEEQSRDVQVASGQTRNRRALWTCWAASSAPAPGTDGRQRRAALRRPRRASALAIVP